MEEETIIIVSVLSAAWGLLLILVLVLWCQLSRLRKDIRDMQAVPRMRVQKLTMDTQESHHAFQNPAIAPDEELSKRGYSMYVGDDVEGQRGTERQTGGQLVEELARELEARHERQTAPPFLLQSIEDKKKKRDLANPVANPMAVQNFNPQHQNHNSQIQNDKLQHKNHNSHNQNHNSNAQNFNSHSQNNASAQRSTKSSSLPRQNSYPQNQNSFLHQNSHKYNDKSNVRQSDTNPNFIY